MPSRAIASSTLWQLFSQITMAALSIVTVKLVAIGLSKELAGVYNSAYGYLQLFGILADFGLYAVAVRELSQAKEEERQRILGTFLFLRICIVVASLSTALFFVWLLPQWQGTPLPVSVLIASLVPFFTLLAGIIRSIFQVTYRMHYVFIAEVTQRIVSTGLIALLVLLPHLRGSTDLQHLHMMLFFGGVGAFVLFAISFVYANTLIRVRIDIDTSLLIHILKRAAPFGLAYLCLAFYRQCDVTMIALLRQDFDVQNAYYGFVVRMTDMGFLLPTFLLNSTLPELSKRDTNGSDTALLLGKTLTVILLIGITAMLFSVVWSKPLIQLLTSERYLSTATQVGSDTALRLVSVPLLLNGIILYSFYVLLNRHRWQRLTATLGVGAGVSLILNSILIPPFGFVGAAYTAIIVHILLAALLLPQAVREMPVRMDSTVWKMLLLYSLGLGASLWLFSPVILNEIATIFGFVAVALWIGVMAWWLRMREVLL